jgi:hypothetical protein
MAPIPPQVRPRGACESSAAALGLSPVPSGALHIEAIFGFRKKIYPKEIEDILARLLGRASQLNTSDFKTELDELRSLVPTTELEAFVLRHEPGRGYAFVSVDRD